MSFEIQSQLLNTKFYTCELLKIKLNFNEVRTQVFSLIIYLHTRLILI